MHAVQPRTGLAVAAILGALLIVVGCGSAALDSSLPKGWPFCWWKTSRRHDTMENPINNYGRNFGPAKTLQFYYFITERNLELPMEFFTSLTTSRHVDHSLPANWTKVFLTPIETQFPIPTKTHSSCRNLNTDLYDVIGDF